MSFRIIPAICYCITAICCFALWRGELEFSTEIGLQHRLKTVSRHATEEKIQRISLENRFKDFQQQVAVYLPRDKYQKLEVQARDLASVIPHSSIVKSELAQSHQFLVSAKEFYVEKKYEEAIQKFSELVSRYPESPASLEASFYLIRAFNDTKNKQEAMDWAERMIRQFPESVWTAKSMLLLADIYREQDRRNEALDTYQLVVATFDDAEIKDEVKKKLAEMGL